MEVYLDNSATTRPSDEVVACVLQSMRDHWHNPSALYKPAMEDQRLMEQSREAVLKACGASGQRLYFTSGGTEADNIAILGHMRTEKKPGTVLLSTVEHPAVSSCVPELERMGHQVKTIPVTHTGTIDLEALTALMTDDVRLICVMQVNNESGAIQPIEEIVRLRNGKAPGAAIHVDGVQGFLRVPIDFNRLGIQSYALSGHKVHALKGIGALVVRKDHRIAPIVFGGGQENGFRSGTENTPGILSLGEAVRTYPADGIDRMRRMKERLLTGILAAVPAAVLNGPALSDPACSPHVLNVSLPPVRSQTMLFALEGDGIYVSAGSACASKKQKVSPILTAMGLPTQMADCALRFSLCPGLTEEQIDYTVSCVRKHYDLLSRYVRR